MRNPLAWAMAAIVSLGAVLFAPQSASAQTLTTIFTGGNFGAVGWTVYFDLTVTTPINVTSLDVNTTSGSGVAFSLAVYRTAAGGTWVGNTSTASAWTLLGSGPGTSAAANTPSACDVSDFWLFPGTYGIAIRYTGVAPAYTNGNGTNQTYSNPDLTLQAGGALETVAAPFVTSGTVFSPRVWNGTIHYTKAQSPLTTLFAGINGGAPGWTVYFDLTVNVPIIVNALDINTTAAAGTPFSLAVYRTAAGGTWVGNTSTPAAWTLVGNGSGAAAGTNLHSECDVSDFALNPGTYGIAIRYTGVLPTYTDGNGSNQVYSNADLTLSAGGSLETVAGPFVTSGTPFSPRVWNGSIYYTVNSCPLGGYSVTPGPATFAPGTTSAGSACDDCTVAIALPFPVSFYGNTYTTVNAGSNGYLDMTTARTTGFYSNACPLPQVRGTTDVAPAAFGPTIMPFWDDQRTDLVAGAGIFTATFG